MTASSLLLSAWLGAAVLFSSVVAPAAFAALPSRTLAGALVGRVLPAVFFAGIVIAAASLVLDRRGRGRSPRVRRSALVVTALACAAALASLQLFDDESEDDRVRIEVAQATQLAALRGVRGVKAVRQIGTVGAVELDATPGYLSDIGRELAAYALQEGVLIRPLGNVAYCLPPYCTSDEEIASVYAVMHRFLDGARAEALSSGGPIDD